MSFGKWRREPVNPLRRLLIELFTLGAPAAMAGSRAMAQGVLGSRPARLPPSQSIYSLRGTARVNDIEASLQTQIRPGDTVETGKESELVFVVGGNSMILRSDSRLVLSGPRERTETPSLIITGLRLLTGKVLSVSRNQPMRVETTVATMASGERASTWNRIRSRRICARAMARPTWPRTPIRQAARRFSQSNTISRSTSLPTAGRAETSALHRSSITATRSSS